jgi:hypothetical protein
MHRGEEQVLDGLAQIVVQALDHAAIEHSHDAIRQEHEVPGMRIRVVDLDCGNAMSRHRVGLALPAGMRGRKP